jgi:hypothetical protein
VPSESPSDSSSTATDSPSDSANDVVRDHGGGGMRGELQLRARHFYSALHEDITGAGINTETGVSAPGRP